MTQACFTFLNLFFNKKIKELKLTCFTFCFDRKVHSKITKISDLCTDLPGDGDSRDN